jgi:hypothetical protein
MKILLFCCKGFEMMEFAPFYDVAGWAKSEYGFDVELDISPEVAFKLMEGLIGKDKTNVIRQGMGFVEV